MSAQPATQRIQALTLLRKAGMTRLADFRHAGITAATVSRLRRDGQVVRLTRGLYQLPDAELDTHHSLAEASKLVPKGVVCLASALAFHGLADHMPSKVWIAIGRKVWRPRVAHPPIRVARFPDALLSSGVERHRVAGVHILVFGVAKTVVDLFRYRREVGELLAVEALREALCQRKAKPGEIARHARDGGVWKTMEPYMLALTSDA